MRLKNILQEALPEKSPIEELREIYEEFHGEELFVSFTKEPKLGINPRSKYDTPLGVYSYPLSYVLERARGNTIDVPFAGDQPYIQVFNQLGNVVVAQEYTENDEQRDYERLIQYYFDYIKESVQHWYAENAEITSYEKVEEIDDFIRQLTEFKDETLIGLDNVIETTNTVMKILFVSSNMFSEVFSEEELNSLINQFDDLKSKFERHGSVYDYFEYPSGLRKELEELLDTTLFFFEEGRSKIRTEFSVEEIFDNAFYFFEEVGKRAIFPTRPFGRLWAVTLHLSRLVEEQNGRKRTVVWNEIFRDALDVYAVVDYGTGIIHKAEPTQAVHFTRETLEHIDQIRNIDYEGKKSRSFLKGVLNTVGDPEAFYKSFKESGITEDDFTFNDQKTIFDRASEVILENSINEDFVKEYVDVLREVLPRTFGRAKSSVIRLKERIDRLFPKRSELKEFEMNLSYHVKFPLELNEYLYDELLSPLRFILRDELKNRIPYMVSETGYNTYHKIKDFLDTIDEFIEIASGEGVEIWRWVYEIREEIENRLDSFDPPGEPRPIIQL